MSLKLYFDLMSQPSRALYIFLKLNKIPFESCPVALRKGEHFTDDFKEKLNKFQKVPFIHHGDFKLAESIAIVRYLSRFHDVSQWYPTDIKEQAKVDEYLEWQHLNTRLFLSLYFRTKFIVPLITGKKPDPAKISKMEADMKTNLDTIEELFLKESTFICGDKISVADIFAACEIEQPRMTGFEPRKGRPILSAWLDRVRAQANPVYDEAHTILNRIAKKEMKEHDAKKAHS